MPLVLMQDAEEYMIDYFSDLLPKHSRLADYKPGVKAAPGVTPYMFIQVRKSGAGQQLDRVGERPRIDIRVWGDNEPAGDHARMKVARILLAHIRRDLGCRIMAEPVNLPDPDNPEVMHTMFTIETILRGKQR